MLGITAPASATAATTLTVATGNDTSDTTDNGVCDAPCSLRGAVQTVDRGTNGQFTIAIPAGTYALSIAAVLPDNSNPDNGDLDITKDTTVVGDGQGTTTINGNSVDRIFDIAAGINATISGLTITGGVARDGLNGTTGGGIRDFGTLTLNDSTLTGNSARYGSGLATDGASFPPPPSMIPNATLNRVTVLNNQGAANSEGGGLNERVGGTLTVNSSLIQGNTANSGGGIVDDGGGTIAINDSTVTANHADPTNSEAGGVWETGGGNVTITRSTISNNTSAEGGGVAEDGGGKVTIVDSAIRDNVVSGGSFPDAGGILNDAGGTVTIRGSTVSGNSATRSGGGIQDIGGGRNDFDIANSTISGNHAGLRGGAIQQGAGAIRLLNSTLHDNTADTGANEIDVCPPSDTACGGNVTRTVTVQNSIVASAAGNCLGPLTSTGHNIDAGDTCGFHTAGDQVNTDPRLAPLAANGGPTLTHAELAGSPAIDHGDPAACPATDQRGIARPVGPTCDIGAFETTNLPAATAATPAPARPSPGALLCTKRKLVLIDVLQRRRGVALRGAADRSLIGKLVSIVFLATHRQVAHAIVQADGSFRTTAALPSKRLRFTNRARYQAAVGGELSDPLKLARRVLLTSVSSAHHRVTISGRLVLPLGVPIQNIAVRQRLNCASTAVVKTFRPSKSGRFSVTFPAPASQSAATYVLVTKVRETTRSRKLFPTASLPRQVDLH